MKRTKSPKFSASLLRQLARDARELPDSTLKDVRGGRITPNRGAVSWPAAAWPDASWPAAWPVDHIDLPTSGF